jgi:hypothetical protein
MIISAFGMMLLFTANQPTGLLVVPYPPFGLVTVSFMGLASFLVFIGIYSAATSVSEDSVLRQSIRKIALGEARFLDAIGTAEMEKKIIKKILAVSIKTRDDMQNKTGVSASLTTDEMRRYISEVLQEIENKHH